MILVFCFIQNGLNAENISCEHKQKLITKQMVISAKICKITSKSKVELEACKQKYDQKFKIDCSELEKNHFLKFNKRKDGMIILTYK